MKKKKRKKVRWVNKQGDENACAIDKKRNIVKRRKRRWERRIDLEVKVAHVKEEVEMRFRYSLKLKKRKKIRKKRDVPNENENRKGRGIWIIEKKEAKLYEEILLMLL